MKILVIGNSGFIGTYLSKKLIDVGFEVVGMDIKPPAANESVSSFVLGDVLNTEDIMKAAKGTEVIINLAAKHHDFGVSYEEFFNVNVQGTKNILDCAAQLGIKKFIFYSTVAVYGNVETHSVENTSPNPISDYGASKLAAEKVIYDWASQDLSRQTIIVRPTVVFGPGNYANVYNLIDKIYKRRFILVGKGDNIKSVAYVENLVDATVFLLKSLKPGIEIYNYSDYPQLTSEQIVKTIVPYVRCNVPKFKLPLKPVLMAANVFDILGKITGYNFPITASRIKKFNAVTHHKSDKIREFGFQAKVSISEGLKRMVEWYLDNRANNKIGRLGERRES
jgi:nucleoside-diphosphate-sugar epimerase